MMSIPPEGRHPPWVSTTVAIVLTLLATVQSLDTTTGAIEYDDMTINWRIETIDEGPHIIPGRTSIAVDPAGCVHVSYHDAVADVLRYAYRPADGNWTSQVIDSPGVGNCSAIGVDSKGAVHIAFEDLANGALKHAVKQPGDDWSIQVVDPGPGTGGFPTLDIDAGDRLIITYLDRSTPSIRIATLDEGGEWNISSIVVGGHPNLGEFDLAIGGNGSLHLVYQASDLVHHYLRTYYASRWPGGEWHVEAEPFSDLSYTRFRMAIGADGVPYVAFGGGAFLLHRFPTGEWAGLSYFKEQKFGGCGDIRFDSKGDFLVCSQTGYGDLRYFEVTPVRQFRTGIVDDRDGTGLCASMAIGPGDRYHIVYYNEADRRVEYATDADRPSEPVDLTATGGERDILLEWGMPARMGNATSVTFNIYRYMPGGVYDLYRSGWTGMSFLDTAVENRVVHRYMVVAVNGVGEGDFPTDVWAMALLRPTRPENVTATAGPDNVVLRWEPPLDPGRRTVTGYRIYWRTGTSSFLLGPEWPCQPSAWRNVTVDASTRSFNHTDLTRGLTYNYEIAAVHASGEGERSPNVSAIPMVPPGPPTALAARRGEGRIVLNWTRPVDDGGCRLTACKVFRGTSPTDLELLTTINGSAIDFNIWLQPSTTLVDNGTVPPEMRASSGKVQGYFHPRDVYDAPGELEDGVTYYYQVSVVQLAGEGPRNHVLEVPPGKTPNAPADLTAQVAEDSVKLTWKQPMVLPSYPPTGYIIYRTDLSGNPIEVGRVGVDTFSYVDRDIESNVTYIYTVRGVNSAGEGKSSDPVEVTVGNIGTGGGPSDDGGHRSLTYIVLAIAAVGLGLGIVMMRSRAGRRDQGD